MTRPNQSTQTRTLLNDDFEGDVSSIWKNDTPKEPHSLTLQDSPKGSGTVARFELRRDDPWVSGSIRSELSAVRLATDAEHWYRFRVLIPDDWEYDPLLDVFAQWHPVPDKDLGEGGAGGPSLSMYIEGDSIRIVNRWDPEPVTTRDSPTRQTEDVWIGDRTDGEWIDWVVRADWSHQDDGVLQIWKDGELIVDKEGPNTYNNKVDPYMKVGIYKWIWKDPAWLDPEDYSKVNTRVLYFDDVLIEEVVGQTTSKPTPNPGGQNSGNPISGNPNSNPPVVDPPEDPNLPIQILGTRKRDRYVGTQESDIFKGLGGKDKINGRSGDDLLYGGGGADKLKGQQGNDYLYGNAGNDRLVGGANDDWLNGGKGLDTYIGGSGCDTYVLQTGRKYDVIKGFDASCDRLFIGTATKFRNLTIEQDGRDTIISLGDDQLVEIKRFDSQELNRGNFIFS